MRMKTFGAVVFLAIISVSGSSVTLDAGQGQRRPTEPDLFDDIAAASIGASIGEGLSRAAQDFVTARERFAEASQEIAAARKAFWAQYPNGPKRAPMEAAFAQKLYAKDLSMLTMALIDRRCSGPLRNTQIDTRRKLLELVGSEIDDGILPGAVRTFCNWVAIAQDRRVPISAATKLPEYETYRRDRDWQEYYRAGKVSIGGPGHLDVSKDVRWYVLSLVWNDEGIFSFPENLERAQKNFEAKAERFGREKILAVAKRLMDAPKGVMRDGTSVSTTLANPGALGCGAFYLVSQCFDELTGFHAAYAAAIKAGAVTTDEREQWGEVARSRNPRDYALYLAWLTLLESQQYDESSTRDTRRARAEKQVAEWAAQWTEATVLKAAQAVQAAPKTPQGGLTYETAKSLGCAFCGAPGNLCQPALCVVQLMSPWSGTRKEQPPAPVVIPAGRPSPQGIPPGRPSPVGPGEPVPNRPGQGRD